MLIFLRPEFELHVSLGLKNLKYFVPPEHISSEANLALDMVRDIAQTLGFHAPSMCNFSHLDDQKS
jgi:hypothetical protein